MRILEKYSKFETEAVCRKGVTLFQREGAIIKGRGTSMGGEITLLIRTVVSDSDLGFRFYFDYDYNVPKETSKNIQQLLTSAVEMV